MTAAELKAALARLGLNMHQAADATGYSHGHVRKMAAGIEPVSARMAATLEILERINNDTR